jgi:ribosomal-protein-alanine N-acetyltransferase
VGTIRKFEPEDLNQILKIETRAFPKSAYTQEVFFHYYLVHPDTFLVFEDETVVGYIIFADDGHVISLAVLPDHRRRGIGSTLMRHSEACCSSGRVWVEVRKGNDGAQAFYAKQGYHLETIVRRYYGSEDAYVLEKKIGRQENGKVRK